VWDVLEGDCLDVLARLAADGNQFDACVTDPPYHLTSTVKRFGAANAAPAQFGTDGAFARASKGFMGRQWDGGDTSFRPETWRRVWDVLKPGAYVVVFGGSRTYGRLQVAIEGAGFITHPMIGWLFGQGFPKAHRLECPDAEGFRYGLQSLKPALEPIYMGQKPMHGTGTENWLAHGCGALNINACRIEAADKTPAPVGHYSAAKIGTIGHTGIRDGSADHLGRWPANLIHDGSDEVMEAFAAYGEGRARGNIGSSKGGGGMYGHGACTNDFGAGDSGSAARFFYCAKATKSDRAGSAHPTVKPLALMRYLTRLITPPGGVVIDPFAGSGTTLQAAVEEGFCAVGIEREAEYVADIRRRMAAFPS